MMPTRTNNMIATRTPLQLAATNVKSRLLAFAISVCAIVALETASPLAKAQEPASGISPAWTETLVPDEARQFWSFQPLAQPEPPAVHDEAWCRTTVDRFIRSRLEDADLAPNPPASKRQLIRRAYFDLIGRPGGSAGR